MTRAIELKEKTILLDTEIEYTGGIPETDEEKDIRRALGLPIKKGLVYYKNSSDERSRTSIKKYQISEMYDITYPWYTFHITLQDDTEVNIHSDFLKDMQKPGFVSEIKAQMDKA